MTSPRIDVHHHYVTIELIEALDEVGVRHVAGQPLTVSPPGGSLAVMDRYQIATALLSVPIPLTVRDPRRVARSLNEAGASAVADARGRFGLLAALPLPDVDGALAEIDYALDTLDADGILLLSNYAGVYLGDPYIEPIFAELDRRAQLRSCTRRSRSATGSRSSRAPDHRCRYSSPRSSSSSSTPRAPSRT